MNREGRISIFLCIIFTSVLLLLFVLIDAARITIVKNQVKRAAENALLSCLGSYSLNIKEGYGLFALDCSKTDALKNDIIENINKNLINKDENINLYDYKIEEIDVNYCWPAYDKNVLKHQILEYMKYRAPEGIVEDIIGKIKIMAKSTKMSAAYKKKINVDRLFGSIEDTVVKAAKYIAGRAADDICVNRFLKDEHLNFAFCEYAALYMKTKNINNILCSTIDEYETKEVSMQEEDKDIYKEKIAGYKETININIESMEKLHNDIYDNVNKYKKAVEKAINAVLAIQKYKNKAENAVDSLDNYIKLELNDVDNNEYINTLKNELESMRNILDIKQIKKTNEILEKNRELLEKLITGTEKFHKENIINRQFIKSKTDYLNIYADAVNDYLDVDFKISFMEEISGYEDDRSKYESIAKKCINAVMGDDIVIPGSLKLPSEKEDTKNSGILAVSSDNIDITSSNSRFYDAQFDFMADIGKVLNEKGEDLRDNIYINEYIISTFSNSVNNKSSSFFRAGVEYILSGNRSQNKNLLKIKSGILLFRFALNTLSAYTDSQKRSLAASIAASLGWWTGGAGIPLISGLILCGWGMGEAVLDINSLYNGKDVPFYKMPKDWQLGITGLKTDGLKRSSFTLDFNYEDYLRIMLLLESEENKLNRIMDLIYLDMQSNNAQESFYDLKCAVHAEITMSVKTVTPVGIILNGKEKMPLRYYFKLELFNGY